MNTSENIQEIATALCKMQGSMSTAIKDSKGYNYTYADYASIMSVIQAPLFENGLSVSQNVTTIPEGVSVVTRILHSSGQFIEHGPLVIPIAKRDAHSIGSGCTYSRRYALCAALNIVVSDDDGAAAQSAAPKQSTPKQTVKPLNQDELDAWLEELYEKGYDPKLVDDYLVAHAKHFKQDIKISASLLCYDNVSFEKNFNVWKEKNR